MGAHKPGDGQKAGNRQRGKAACRADTRGGSWAGIPKCLIDSPAYRDLSLHARAVLVELVARMNGYNNGAIAAGQRELREAIGCRPQRIIDALAELLEHGILDVTIDGQWRARQARQYRLTFVSTATAPATNDYLRWTPTAAKSGVTDVVTGKAQSATDVVTAPPSAATHVVTAKIAAWRETAGRVPPAAATDVVTLIYSHGTPAPSGERRGYQGISEKPPCDGGHCSGNGTEGRNRTCEQCGTEFELGRDDRAYPRRFCSETCRKRAEKARAYRRSKGEDEATPIGKVLNGHLSRFMARQAKAGRAH